MTWFTPTETYRKTVSDGNGNEAEVIMRSLNAGDQAAIQDTLRMEIGESANASMALGTMRMLVVQKALVDWTIPGPKPSPEAISQLEPDVFEQIYAFAEIGTTPPTTLEIATAQPPAAVPAASPAEALATDGEAEIKPRAKAASKS